MIRYSLLDLEATPISRKHPTDAGIDLYACIDSAVLIINPGDWEVVNTKVAVEIPQGWFGWITNKSRNVFLVGAGIVDADYQGELLIKIFNPTNSTVTIRTGDSIAQLLIIPCSTEPVERVEPEFLYSKKSERGATGGIVYQSGGTPNAV